MAEPKVRFKQNDGTSFPAWENNTIGHYLQIRDEKQTPSELAPLMAFIAYQGVADKGDRYDRSFLVKSDDKKYKRTEFNDFIYSSNNLDVGSIGLNKYGSAVISVVYEIFKCKENCIPDCINALLQMPQSIAKMLKYRQGALYGQYKIPAEDFLSIRIDMPCLEEQQKIADFLSSVDEVITASEEEVVNLETQKKAVMKKIFSQEVRFKRADGSVFPEWEEKPLEKLADFSKGQGYTKSDLTDAGHPIILYGRLYTKYQTVISEVDTFAEMRPKSVLSKKGDVIVPASGETAEDISVAAVVDADGIILGGDLNIIHPNDEILPAYLAYSLTFGTPHNEMAKRAQGKSVVHLHNADLKTAKIVYPHRDEQAVIVKFLSDFDKAIVTAKKELELWKELKKGLLQQMFV